MTYSGMDALKKKITRDFSRETISEPAQSPTTMHPRNPERHKLTHRGSEPALFRNKLKPRSLSLVSPDDVNPPLPGTELCRRILAVGTSLLSVGKIVGNVIYPTRSEVACRKLYLVYSSRSDEYRRLTDSSRADLKGWKKLVYAERNMELVTEHRFQAWSDVVMTFLSRTPGRATAFVQWDFDLSLTGLRVRRLMLKLQHDIFDDGHISVHLKGDGESNKVPVYGTSTLREVPDAQGWTRFSLIVDIGCRRGACTFEHSKLFYQSQRPGILESFSSKFPFVVKIYLTEEKHSGHRPGSSSRRA